MIKLIIAILLFTTLLSCTKRYDVLTTIVMQNGSSSIYVITKDTLLNTVWDLKGNNLIFETGGHISGKGTLQNGFIVANYYQNLFGTMLTVNLQPALINFSARWFGANPLNVDNYQNIQKSINTCIANSTPLFIPKGIYSYSKPLIIQNIYKGVNVGVSLHLFGETQFWDATNGTTLNYTSHYDFGLGVQLGKGFEIDHLKISGQRTSPTTPASVFYLTKFEDYNDPRCNNFYYGIVVDPFKNNNGSQNGSTGCKFHDLYVTKFSVLYCVSPNQGTSNADILLFENIHCGQGKVGFQANQAQEKGNVIRGIYSWERIHTLISIGNSNLYQAGFYTIDGGNVAGGCVRLFNISTQRWYASSISNLYAESIGTVGTIYTAGLPVKITHCNFDFVTSTEAPSQTLLYTYDGWVTFDNSVFRYYGASDILHFSGHPTFINCSFSGLVQFI